ncbi:MAG: helix-turn-helix transcriptional regulator [Flavitalea sp.]
MTLSSRESRERIKKGLTQEELASLANITVRTIQRIESGESLPRMYTIKAIASALDIPFELLAQKPELSSENSTAIDLETEHHFLYLFCLSCFSYIAVTPG